IKSECQRLQEDMLAFGKLKAGDVAAVFDGTIDGLIGAYLSDQDSGFQNLRYKSRETYKKHLKGVSRTVGKRALSEIKGRDFKRWYENWSANGQHVPRANYRMTMVRLIVSFGVAILEDPHCIRLNTILAEHSFEGNKKRTATLTPEQIDDIRRHARAKDRPGLALGEALKFSLMFRPKDAYGEWIPVSEPGLSAIIRKGMKWVCGVDWSEVDSAMLLTHRISKSIRGKRAMADQEAGKTKRFQLTLYPMIMEELAKMAAVSIQEVRRDLFPASGPMVLNRDTGLPYIETTLRLHWREVADLAGVSKKVQGRDARASRATQAERLGISEDEIRKGLGHARPETTRIYTRGEDEVTANIAKIIVAKQAANSVTNKK
ncbi:MAG: hypothetical protein EON84_21190, partial [Bradyrhizobiaceae bacterium]